MSNDLSRHLPVSNASFVLSERAQRAIENSIRNRFRATRRTDNESLDRVRRNLDAQLAEDNTPVLELHPNVIIERQFEFLDASLCNANADPRNSIANESGDEHSDDHDSDARRLPPTEGDARSDTSADTQTPEEENSL